MEAPSGVVLVELGFFLLLAFGVANSRGVVAGLGELLLVVLGVLSSLGSTSSMLMPS